MKVRVTDPKFTYWYGKEMWVIDKREYGNGKIWYLVAEEPDQIWANLYLGPSQVEEIKESEEQ